MIYLAMRYKYIPFFLLEIAMLVETRRGAAW